MRIPTPTTISTKILSGEMTREEVEAVITTINEKIAKNRTDESEWKKTLKIAETAIAGILANSVENELLTAAKNTTDSGIVIDSINTEDTKESTKVM